MVAVWAVTGARRPGVAGLHGDALRLRVAAPPERGRANLEAARLLGDALGAPVELLAGATGRRKRFLVRGLTPAVVAARLRE